MNELTDEQIKETLIAAGHVPQWPSGDIHPAAYAGARAIIAADRALRASPPGDAGLPVVQWQKRHPDYDDGVWKNTNEGDAKWWRDSSSLAYEVRELVKQADALAALDVFRENILSKMAIIKSQREEMNQLRADRAQRQAGQVPLFWVRLRSDGGYEGPIHDGCIEAVRKQSGGWTPLYTAPPPAQIKSGKHLSDFLSEASKAGVTHLNLEAPPPAQAPLTLEEIEELLRVSELPQAKPVMGAVERFARAIEQAHGIR